MTTRYALAAALMIGFTAVQAQEIAPAKGTPTNVKTEKTTQKRRPAPKVQMSPNAVDRSEANPKGEDEAGKARRNIPADVREEAAVLTQKMKEGLKLKGEQTQAVQEINEDIIIRKRAAREQYRDTPAEHYEANQRIERERDKAYEQVLRPNQYEQYQVYRKEQTRR
ncbi:MAG: hypothetical protein WBA12_06440 [Catalinimonas sp.]